MTRRSPRQVAITAIQYVIAGLALWWLLAQIEVAQAARQLASLEPPIIAGLLGVSLLGALAQFGTWAAVLWPMQRVALRAVASVSLAVNFVNQLLPSRLSGRVAAPFVIRAETGMDYADAAAAAGVPTGIYAVVYGVASTVGLVAIAVAEPASLGLLSVLALSTGLYLAAGLLVLTAGTNLRILDPIIERLANALARVPRYGTAAAERIRGLTDVTESSTAGFRALVSDSGVWIRYGASWAVVLLLAPAVRVWLMFQGLGVVFEPAVLLPLYLVTAYSVTLLPLSPGGVGVTEATATAVFVALGVPADVVVPIVFVDRILGIYLPAVLGWVPAARLDLSRLAAGQNGG
jgi:uncharacterized protein (TIRG00374 family)